MKPKEKKNRRVFLRKSLERMVLPSLAALTGDSAGSRPTLAPDQMLPGDPGHRDPEGYGSLAEPDELE